MAERNDVDTTIDLDCMEPPTFQGRVLVWTGDTRIPQPGELVFLQEDLENDEPIPAVVVGYFQAHGWLGVKIRFDSGEIVGAFGTEIVVSPDEPAKEAVN